MARLLVTFVFAPRHKALRRALAIRLRCTKRRRSNEQKALLRPQPFHAHSFFALCTCVLFDGILFFSSSFFCWGAVSFLHCLLLLTHVLSTSLSLVVSCEQVPQSEKK